MAIRLRIHSKHYLSGVRETFGLPLIRRDANKLLRFPVSVHLSILCSIESRGLEGGVSIILSFYLLMNIPLIKYELLK